MLGFRDGWTGSMHSMLLGSLICSNCVSSVSQESKQHILGPLSVLRPKFRVGYSPGLASICFDSLTGHSSVADRYRMYMVFQSQSSCRRLRRIWFLSRKPSSACCWITIECFRQWEYRLAFGEGQVRYTREIVNLPSSLGLKGTCFVRSVTAPSVILFRH
jgi:hypothetical protein